MRNKIKILWLLFSVTLIIQFVGNLLYFVVFNETHIVQLVYGVTKITMLASPILFYFAGFKLPRFNLKHNISLSLIYGVITGLIMSGLILAIYFIFQPFFGQFAPNILIKIADFGILKYYWPAAIVISVLHSFFEEYYWRWYAVCGLSTKMANLNSILLGNFFFTLHHYIILSQFVPFYIAFLFGTCVGFGGVIWSHIYKRTGSLLGSWISHTLVDLCLFTIGYLLLN